jgi:hypothetical protein
MRRPRRDGKTRQVAIGLHPPQHQSGHGNLRQLAARGLAQVAMAGNSGGKSSSLKVHVLMEIVNKDHAVGLR